ncbi:MAG: hypothetical protein JWN40_4032 [Phycisphaerales bacterium]|jgi:protein-L-isoaspartate O-methyltransferase|nr:hypothetical protein [Phycisphaerales bacterium]
MFGIKTRLQRFYRTKKSIGTNYSILRDEYGQWNSFWNSKCLDKDGNFVPWFTYPAIEYIKQLDLTDKRVLEYGSGFSTMFWAKRTKSVVSIEDDKAWYEKLKPQLPANVNYIHVNNEQEYVGAVGKLEGQFDIIINDGIYRLSCAKASRPKLADGGIVILDNSDWCAQACAYYRDSDLIEVDMAGFTPLNAYPMTTSFFFSRSVKLKPAHDHQPVLAVGGQHISEDDLSLVRG